jgi:uncharacterized RDD family membrane protein YckC
MCGTALPSQSRYCRSCGSELYPEEAPPLESTSLSANEPDGGANLTPPLEQGMVEKTPAITATQPPGENIESHSDSLTTDAGSEISSVHDGVIVQETVVGSMWMRCLAFLLDYIVVFFIAVTSAIILGVVGALSGTYAVIFGALTAHEKLYGYMLLVAYMTTALSIFHTTVGKALCNLRVVSTIEDEEFPTIFPILLREAVGRFVSSFLFGWGYWAASGKPGKQAWSDEMANTRVIKAEILSRRAKVIWGAVLAIFLIIDCWAFLYTNDNPSQTTSSTPANGSPNSDVANSPKPTGQSGYSDKLPAGCPIHRGFIKINGTTISYVRLDGEKSLA